MKPDYYNEFGAKQLKLSQCTHLKSHRFDVTPFTPKEKQETTGDFLLSDTVKTANIKF